MQWDTIIIGGGPAGMMAAITSANNGKKTVIIEKNLKLGRKLAITGKGRCNITNDCTVNELLNNVTTNSKFLYSSFNQFNSQSTINFFNNNGLKTKTERGNRVFPMSDKAFDVVDTLKNATDKAQVKIITADIEEILTTDNKIVGVKTTTKDIILGNSVIIATGGVSYPLTGSDGTGYELAKGVGHTIEKLRPSLVPLVSKDLFCKQLQGLSLKNVSITITEKESKKTIYKEQGEMIFTHFGISGPIILSASAHMKKHPSEYSFSIDLKPALTLETLDKRVLRDFENFIHKDLTNGLVELLPKKIISVIIYIAQLSPVIKIHQINKEMRQSLVNAIKNLPIDIIDFAPIDEAIITTGGVKVKEINPKTMESKIIEGLFFAGEVIDVDAYTGGFNLQIAFSTGYVAGLNS